MDHKLTPKQQAFADHYLETGNATESAKLAGYSKKTANVIGAENLAKPYIREYIDERLKEASEKRIAKADEVLEYFTKVMRGEEKDAFGLDASLADRNKAAENLGKRYGLFTEKRVLTGEDGGPIKTEATMTFYIPDNGRGDNNNA